MISNAATKSLIYMVIGLKNDETETTVSNLTKS